MNDPKIFACSDHHFYHKNIIKYCDRPFDINNENCVIDNAKLMIERHNETVSDDDFCLFVGDLSAGLRNREEHFASLLKTLNGKKILVRGNHDHLPDQFYLDAGFIDVVQYFKTDNYFICHYPCYKSTFNKKTEKYYISMLEKTSCKNIIHGHIHNKDPKKWDSDGYNRKNVCVDFKENDYYPQKLNIKEIEDFVFHNYQ